MTSSNKKLPIVQDGSLDLEAALHERYERLVASLKDWGSVAVAFSGGVDSTFLLSVAHETLGERAIAFTARSPLVPLSEIAAAQEFCESQGIRQVMVDFDPFAVEGFAENPPDRCYVCKRALFGELLRQAKEAGFIHVADGSNTDDVGDYRPGMRALDELGIESPLRAAGLAKADIRALSRKRDLPTWDMPSYACLASRIPYGEQINGAKLARIEAAESVLHEAGCRQARVRSHGDIARIEVPSDDIEKLAQAPLRNNLSAALRDLGFSFVTLDLEGYRTGSMNEVLEKPSQSSQSPDL